MSSGPRNRDPLADLDNEGLAPEDDHNVDFDDLPPPEDEVDESELGEDELPDADDDLDDLDEEPDGVDELHF